VLGLPSAAGTPALGSKDSEERDGEPLPLIRRAGGEEI
jgi:hypothetical protein